MFDKERALKDMKDNLSERRYIHSFAVGKTARELAEVHGEDPEIAFIAGIFHDFAKYMSHEESQLILNKMGESDEFLLKDARLAHGMIGAYILKTEYGLDDEYILSAIEKHTFGDVNMSLLDKIIYIADATEENRDYPNCDKIRELSKKNLDLASLEYLKNSVKYLMDDGKKIYTKSIEMYNILVERGKNGF